MRRDLEDGEDSFLIKGEDVNPERKAPRSTNPLESYDEQLNKIKSMDDASPQELQAQRDAQQYEATPDDENALLMSKLSSIIGRGASNYAAAMGVNTKGQAEGFDSAEKFAQEKLKLRDNLRKQLLDKAAAAKQERLDKRQGMLSGLSTQMQVVNQKTKEAEIARQDQPVSPAKLAFMKAMLKSKSPGLDANITEGMSERELSDLEGMVAKLPQGYSIEKSESVNSDGTSCQQLVAIDPTTGKKLWTTTIGSKRQAQSNKAEDKPLDQPVLDMVNAEQDKRGLPHFPAGTTPRQVDLARRTQNAGAGVVGTELVGGGKVSDVIQGSVAAGKSQQQAEEEAKAKLSLPQRIALGKVIQTTQKTLQPIHDTENQLNSALAQLDDNSKINSTKGILQSLLSRGVAGEKGVLTDADVARTDAATQDLFSKAKRAAMQKITGEPFLPEDKENFKKVIAVAKRMLEEKKRGVLQDQTAMLQTTIPGAPVSWLGVRPGDVAAANANTSGPTPTKRIVTSADALE